MVCLFYGVGHMLNDVTSSCWFTYLLVFLTNIGLSPRDAATVMLSGQIADGFATIFAGELIDSNLQFGLGCQSGFTHVMTYSDRSMVNCTTLNSSSRVVLASCRNAFTMVANLSVYGIALIVFNFSTPRTISEVENQYLWIAYLSVFIGCFFVGIFHLGTQEPSLKQGIHGKSYARISWACWFKKVLYYQVALVYVLTRLVTNVSQAFLAFYVINDLQMTQSSKALVPAIIYISSFIVSVLLQGITWTGQRVKIFYSAGSILWIFCGTGILSLPRSMNVLMYFLSTSIGIANALMTVTGVSMQSFLVGEDLDGCAFVCGSLSFLEKISCGFAIFILESYQNSSSMMEGCNSIISCFSVTRYSVGLVPAICALVGVLFHNLAELFRIGGKIQTRPKKSVRAVGWTSNMSALRWKQCKSANARLSSGLKQVVKSHKKCLCVIVKYRNDPDLGLNINGSNNSASSPVASVKANTTSASSMGTSSPEKSSGYCSGRRKVSAKEVDGLFEAWSDIPIDHGI
ncbi:hypothetical protein F0562_014562 [Nyssa sinensis]|uniref:Major facilitator superfamily (MFS) profile domain-containing protein n=1 Tax=Nyssa sinensis TaxID=561372 RepID=A0A5J4ZRE3_9ASTE|nr:hypothetical protein F0562_014562 [Nyssa sinensis]